MLEFDVRGVEINNTIAVVVDHFVLVLHSSMYAQLQICSEKTHEVGIRRGLFIESFSVTFRTKKRSS